jgi:hypothetical protein
LVGRFQIFDEKILYMRKYDGEKEKNEKLSQAALLFSQFCYSNQQKIVFVLCDLFLFPFLSWVFNILISRSLWLKKRWIICV